MALNRVQRYLSILFFTSLIFTQALVYVAVRAANNYELLSVVYIEPVSANLEIGDSIYFQAMLAGQDSANFDFVNFNLQNPQTGLDENYQASLKEDGTWKAQSIWDTSYNYQPGSYYLSVVAYDYNNDDTIIYSSDYSLIYLSGEFKVAAVSGDFGYFASPQEAVVIDPLDTSERMMTIDFRIEADASQNYVKNINFVIESDGATATPASYTASRANTEDGYEVWTATVDTNVFSNGNYIIYANISVDAEFTPPDVVDNFNNIDNNIGFTVERNTLETTPVGPTSVNVVSPVNGVVLTTNSLYIEVTPNSPLIDTQAVNATIVYRGIDISISPKVYTLEKLNSTSNAYVKTIDIGTGVAYNSGDWGIDTSNLFPDGDYTIEFSLLSSNATHTPTLGSVSLTLDRTINNTTPNYTVTINNPSAGERIIGNDLLLQLTMGYPANTIDIHLLPENHEELAVDLSLPASASSNSFQTTLSATSYGFVNGNYLLSVTANYTDSNIAETGPITFYWQITEEDPNIDPDLLSYQPSSSTIGPGDVLVGSANVANIDFKLINASDANQTSYTLSGVTNISCTNTSVLGTNFSQLKPANHNFCFYVSISDNIANDLINRGNYNFYLEYMDNGVSYTSPPVLVTYYSDSDEDTIPGQEFIFLKPQENTSISNNFNVVVASNVDYATGLEIELESISSDSNSNYLSAARSSWSQAALRFGLAQASYPDLAFVYISEPINSKLFTNGRYNLKIATDFDTTIQISINNVSDSSTTPADSEEGGSGNDNINTTPEIEAVPAVTTAPVNTNNLAIDIDTTCLAQGITDQQACQRFTATIASLDQNCVTQSIYDDQACEDYLYRIRIDAECQASGIIDREECKNYLLEEYGSKVDCRLSDSNLCNSVLRNRYLSRLVVGQKLSDNISQAVDPLIGKNISTQELNDTLITQGVDSKTILPLVANQDTRVLVFRAQPETILEEENELTILNQAVIVLDADGDNLSDDLEDYYGTGINNPDTDGDGYSDGTEINNGYDPAGPGKLSKIRTNLDKVLLAGVNVLEQPKNRSTKIDSSFKVETVDAQDKKVKLYGQAEADTWVTLYMYSDLPLVMTTKTDASGNWSYDIKNSLTDGHHKVYVTVNDDTGKIVKQSRPISFLIKEAQAVTVDDYFDESTVTQEVNNLFIYYILGGAFLVFLALGILLFIHKDKKNLEL